MDHAARMRLYRIERAVAVLVAEYLADYAQEPPEIWLNGLLETWLQVRRLWETGKLTHDVPAQNRS